MSTPFFTKDWSSHMRTLWPLHVLPRTRPLPVVHWLEIGSFEGRSTLWTVENVLHGEGSSITCIDVWEVWPWHDGQPIPFDYEKTFDRNVAGLPQVRKIKGRSQDILPTLHPRSFHGALIDGSHETEDVIEDARMVAPLLLPGGIMVFDDYDESSCPGVQPGVDAFLAEAAGKVAALHLGKQAICCLKPEG
jgi:hypothetical protein